MNRRRFCLTLGGASASTLFGPDFASGAVAGNTFETSSVCFGASARIVVRHQSRSVAWKAMESAFEELARIETLMSIYDPGSQLSILNRAGRLRSPHPLLVKILRRAQKFSVATDSAFDVTVQPLWNLFHKSNAGRFPSQKQIANARRMVGHRNMDVRAGMIRLMNDASVTLNGIAQGFATDRARQVLLTHGIQHALIDIGELAGIGEKENGTSWKAGIQHPREESAYSMIVAVENRCLATSGDYAATFGDGFSDHHIFDPNTGRSPVELASVSVLAPSATEADALSTALMVLGVERGTRILKRHDNVDALFVLKNGRSLATGGFPRGVA